MIVDKTIIVVAVKLRFLFIRMTVTFCTIGTSMPLKECWCFQTIITGFCLSDLIVVAVLFVQFPPNFGPFSICHIPPCLTRALCEQQQLPMSQNITANKGPLYHFICWLTQWGRDKMATISQTTFSDVISWMKSVVFWLKLHWILFLRV